MTLPDPVRLRLEGWKAKLIDLSRANRLLHYRHHRASSVEIVEEDPREVLSLLAAGKKLSFDARPETPLVRESRLRTGDLRLQTDLPREHLDKVLQKLFRDSRSSLEEQGFNTLFLALGILELRVPGDAEPWRAPLLLFPVQLARRGARSDYTLTAYEDDTRINPALSLKLEKELGIPVTLPDAGEGLSYDAVRSAFAPLTEGRDGWRIVDELHLAPFSFSRVALYEDLVRHAESIGTRPIVTTLATGIPSAELRLGPLPSPSEVESAPEAALLSRILDADSSQEAAILAARRGHSFVIQGPPGTGKSQTIANIIADALSAGRTVLFVSEKMAALEVVQRRLEHAGLGDFCLELHSNKANKREVVQSLGRAWKKAAERAAPPKGHTAELRDVSAHLRSYVEELGAPRGRAGLLAHRIFGEATRLASVPEVTFPMESPQDVDGATLVRILHVLRDAADIRRVVEPARANPWRGVRRSALGVSTADDVRRAINVFHTALVHVRKACDSLSQLTGAEAGRTVGSLARGLDVARHLEASPGVPPAFLAGPSWAGLTPRAEALVSQGVERRRLRESLLDRYETSVLEVDASSWLPRARPGGGPFGWFRRRRLRRDLGGFSKGGEASAIDDAAADLRAVARVRDLSKELEGASEWLRSTFGDSWEGIEGDWDRLSARVGWVRQLQILLPPGATPSDATRAGAAGARRSETKAAADETKRHLDALEARWAELVALLELDVAGRFGTDWREVDLEVLEETVEAMAEAMDGLPDWAAWQAKRASAASLGLGAYLDAFDERDLESRHLVNGWFRAFFRGLADWVLAQSPLLREFQGHLHETRVSRYRDLERKQLEANAPITAAALRAKAPSPSVGAVVDSEPWILLRQVALQTRHMATRKLFEKIPTLLRTLKPCLMMSPLSVATYLPADKEPFDLVVFDEASQICTEDAVGALARGRQVVVAGDSKQLPPTSFFESRLAERDDAPEDTLVDMKSILEECSAGLLPERSLLWHYRSRDESLISFSNGKFYGDTLITFPNPVRDPSRLGISFVHVKEGVYDPGRSRANLREAEVVADTLFRMLRERPEDTFGVVTFSTTQRDAVLDAIDVRRRRDESFESRFSSDALEDVFVKNLESVQGDERDVILFSIGYGRDAAGSFLHNFGPLNADGGERRLNVAVSRARKQMIVFASIQPEDIDPARVSRPGARLLREYLERARRGLERDAVKHAAPDDEALAALVRAVREEVRLAGYEAEVSVGESGFRIDVAVRHPEQRDRFMLGLLCDAPAAKDSTTVRDRERIRHEVLTRLGWRIHRVWAPDWLRFRDREANRLRALLETARREPSVPAPAPPAPPVPRSPAPAGLPEEDVPRLESTPPQGAVVEVDEYRVATLRGGEPEAFHGGRADLLSGLRRVVEVEGPVHLSVAARRVADAFGLQRVTERVLGRVSDAAKELERQGTLLLRGDFLYVPGAPDPTVRGPGGGVQRPLEHVAPEELAAALTQVVGACVRLSEDALVRETARLYGFQRTGDQLSAVLRAAIAHGVAAGHLRRDENGWIGPP